MRQATYSDSLINHIHSSTVFPHRLYSLINCGASNMRQAAHGNSSTHRVLLSLPSPADSRSGAASVPRLVARLGAHSRLDIAGLEEPNGASRIEYSESRLERATYFTYFTHQLCSLINYMHSLTAELQPEREGIEGGQASRRTGSRVFGVAAK